MKSYKQFIKESNESDKFDVIKDSQGYHIKFSCSIGKGRALLMDKETFSRFGQYFRMEEGEMFLFGIDTTPINSGIGRIFLNKIFDYFNLSKIYLPSSENHPVWNKIATKTDSIITMGGKDSVIYTLTKNQLLKRFNESNESEYSLLVQEIEDICLDLNDEYINTEVLYDGIETIQVHFTGFRSSNILWSSISEYVDRIIGYLKLENWDLLTMYLGQDESINPEQTIGYLNTKSEYTLDLVSFIFAEKDKSAALIKAKQEMLKKSI